MSSTQQQLGEAYEKEVIEQLTNEILRDINIGMLDSVEKENEARIIYERKEKRREERIAKRDELRAKKEYDSKNRILDSLGGGLTEDDDDHCGFNL